MRRALSTLLLVIFSLPLIAQALAWNPAPVTPACCRRAGAHHCAMAGQPGHTDSGPQATQQRCPLFPQSGTISPTARFTAPDAAATVVAIDRFGFTTLSQHHAAPSLALPGSIHKRGPPASLNSL